MALFQNRTNFDRTVLPRTEGF